MGEKNKIFVGGLAWSVTSEKLGEAFAKCGDVVDAKVITDRETNMSKGFGFVTFASFDGLKAALQLDGQDIEGRKVRVAEAQDKKPQDRQERREYR